MSLVLRSRLAFIHPKSHPRLEVENTHSESKDILHEIVSACLLDWADRLAIASQRHAETGVSTNRHTGFCLPSGQATDSKLQARQAMPERS